MCPSICNAVKRGRKDAVPADKCAKLSSSFFTVETGSRVKEGTECQELTVAMRQVRSLLTELELMMSWKSTL